MLKLKGEIEQDNMLIGVGMANLLSDKNSQAFKALDMVAFNQGKNVGIVLQVDLQTGTAG
jgi:hypothetical protein